MAGQIDGFLGTDGFLSVTTSYGSTVIVETYQRQ
jgi:hypothetical protein